MHAARPSALANAPTRRRGDAEIRSPRVPASPFLGVFLALLFVAIHPARAAEPFLKKGDVIALVGGEDMVVAGELGYLELLLTRALPDYQLRFRNLAWEGDTVFAQRRDLNFPPLEAQLDQVGATVVICQFGQMESLAGKDKLPEFIAAYEKLIERMNAGGKRRIVMLTPFAIHQSLPMGEEMDEFARQMRMTDYREFPALKDYTEAIEGLGNQASDRVGDSDALERRTTPKVIDVSRLGVVDALLQRDGIHLTQTGHESLGNRVGHALGVPFEVSMFGRADPVSDSEIKKATGLLRAIRAKNRLWFDYWRVQNWAFLAGDRTNQPSSRDHRDPSQRWFPAEREAFLPLIAAKEREIDALAAQLAKP